MMPASYAPRDPPPDNTNPIFGRDAGDCTVHYCRVDLEPRATSRNPRCLRHMRRLCTIAVLTAAGMSHADTPWSEYGPTTRLRPAVQLAETVCEIDVSLRGAIAQV